MLDGYTDSTPIGRENHPLTCGFTPLFSIGYADVDALTSAGHGTKIQRRQSRLHRHEQREQTREMTITVMSYLVLTREVSR